MKVLAGKKIVKALPFPVEQATEHTVSLSAFKRLQKNGIVYLYAFGGFEITASITWISNGADAGLTFDIQGGIPGQGLPYLIPLPVQEIEKLTASANPASAYTCIFILVDEEFDRPTGDYYNP